MQITTTLAALRKHGACIYGYNKLVSSLKGIPFDPDRETYIRFASKEIIPLSYILQSNGLDDALWALRASNASDRDMRLYAVWFARQGEHLLIDQRSKNAINVAEMFANGLCSREELAAAWAAAWAAASDAARAARAAARAAAWAAAWAAAGKAQSEMFLLMCEGKAPWQISK